MRLLYLIPGMMHASVLGTEEMERRRAILQKHAFPGTVVDVADTDTGPASIESICEEYASIPPTVERAVRAQAEGYDGIILGCYADPGIDALREMLTIPVSGPFESSCFAAMTLGHRFSILTVTPDMCPVLEAEFESKGGAGRRLASVRAIDLDILALQEYPELLKKRLCAEAELAITQDRADTLVLGCISLAFADMDLTLENAFGVPCVNPILTALKQCESHVSMGLHHSKRAYALPRKLRQQA
ncbi:allantoin racemase [Oscillibacter sp. PC13]|uniref:aspartate/glutamate racemase family protein n=1 Tax=Oscillibacter sp. PC13 TaxID=1855299 RepID=UPI0008EFE925|nr:aspartate/glutamate racemase family protein [Oscillibacter sp. PC13]SFP25403.1 allantoin racemase [Oscillibacter sp. PC13]